jgi:hypothetical protein
MLLRTWTVEQLNETLGSVPPLARKQAERASPQEIHNWAEQILRSTTLEETLS